MSASDESSKVNLTDPADDVIAKINDAYCPQGDVEENGVLEYLRFLVFPILTERGENFVIERPEKYGGNIVYESYGELEADFVAEELHPLDLKNATGAYISDIIDPIRERFADKADLLAKAYPEKYA